MGTLEKVVCSDFIALTRGSNIPTKNEIIFAHSSEALDGMVCVCVMHISKIHN